MNSQRLFFLMMVRMLGKWAALTQEMFRFLYSCTAAKLVGKWISDNKQKAKWFIVLPALCCCIVFSKRIITWIYFTSPNLYPSAHKYIWVQSLSLMYEVENLLSPVPHEPYGLYAVLIATHILLCPDAESSSVPPDVTSSVPQDRNSRVEVSSSPAVKGMSRGSNRSSMMETADGECAPSWSTQPRALQQSVQLFWSAHCSSYFSLHKYLLGHL